MRSNRFAVAVAALPLLMACEPPAPPTDGQGDTAPTEQTRRAQAAAVAGLDLDERDDFEDAERGLVAREAELRIRDAEGRVIWDPSQYAFEEGAAPDSVNASLWRQARLNNHHGLYRVADRIYQVRGYDLANLSILMGETGWILVDPLTSRETAAAALAMARQQLGQAPGGPARARLLGRSRGFGKPPRPAPILPRARRSQGGLPDRDSLRGSPRKRFEPGARTEEPASGLDRCAASHRATARRSRSARGPAEWRRGRRSEPGS